MTNLGPGTRPVARTVGSMGQEAFRLVRGVAFWAGVVLPVLYLPIVVGGVVQVGLQAFVALVAANYLALLAGAGHGRPPRARE